MKDSIVEQLAAWVHKNAVLLADRGITVSLRPASPEAPWKSSVGLEYRNLLIGYTVWERTILQTELVIFDTTSKKTLMFSDGEPTAPTVIHADLDGVVQKILDGRYE